MKREVLNNIIGSPYDLGYPTLSAEQENNILAELFEQLLIFDKVIISTNRLNFSLFFLIKKLGLNNVERLFDSGYIKLLLWSPLILTGTGRQREDGTIDESIILGQPPIVGGSLSSGDTDPEKNIHNALIHFNLHRDRKRILTRRIEKNYIIPNGLEYSTDSAKFVIDSYLNNNLTELGLPFVKEPDQLILEERRLLLGLGYRVLETALISKYELKSYQNYEHFTICKQNLKNIGKAYNISENTSTILKLENLPDLKTLFLSERLTFDNVFILRHLSNAKFYRKWINEIGEDSNAQEISKEYLNQIKGSSKFFESYGGKFIRNIGMFGVSSALGSVIAGTVGVIAGFSLGLLDTYVLDNILKGKNPSMFVDDIRDRIRENENQEF
ncbi:MAG: hypothetical protein Q7J05_09340 [Paludibacter sp.]|nr:hypothetical protein [Paludibacter sp.]